MSIENTVSFLLARVGSAHRNLIEASAQEIGLHAGQIFVLLELWKTDGLRQIDLATRLGVSPATVNKTIGGLIGSDFVTRRKLENDGRSTRICLTEKGRNIRGPVEEIWEILDQQTTDGLTDAEELMVSQLLPKLLI